MGTPDLTSQAGLRQVSGDRREALHDAAATRRIEQQAAAALPEHMLMARAGLALARLARALQPHAQCIWIARGLPVLTWYRFFGWLGIGLVIYFIYGLRKSRLQKASEA